MQQKTRERIGERIAIFPAGFDSRNLMKNPQKTVRLLYEIKSDILKFESYKRSHLLQYYFILFK